MRLQQSSAQQIKGNPRGQSPRGYGIATHGLPACRRRDAGRAAGRAVEPCGFKSWCPPNGLEVHLRGQGPRAEARAARGAPACEARECAPRDAARF